MSYEVSYKLKEREIERRKITCEVLFDRFKRKSFLHRIVTGDEKWIYQFQAQKIMGTPRPIINITTSAQYSWKEGFAMYLMGSEGSCVL